MRCECVFATMLTITFVATALAQEDDAKRKDAEARIQELNARVGQLYGQGKYADARAAAEESLALAVKALGPEHPHTAGSLNNLAMLLKAMGDLKGARPLCERALAVAGARGFMLSLWKVTDAQTRELMGDFYAGLWRDKPQTAEEALRALQLHVLSADRQRKAFRPSTWGAWTLIQ